VWKTKTSVYNENIPQDPYIRTQAVPVVKTRVTCSHNHDKSSRVGVSFVASNFSCHPHLLGNCFVKGSLPTFTIRNIGLLQLSIVYHCLHILFKNLDDEDWDPQISALNQ